ncbi:competence protein CoiA [Planococcus versutus]|nr:competence protein CoiA family protein [Planococcus versutus]
MEERRVVIILVAKTSNQKLFYLTNQHSRQELHKIRTHEQFFCPTCQASVHLKIGEINIPHFAHKALSSCDQFSEPESSLHLHGKLLLHNFFKKLNHTVDLEKYLSGIRQRTDVFVNERYAIEFQCSPIPVSQLFQRSDGYKRLNVHPVWIKGLKEPLREEIGLVHLQAYEVAMFQQADHFSYLLLFHPPNNRFYYQSNLFYVSGNRWVGKTKSLQANQQIFPFALPNPLTRNEFKLVIGIFQNLKRQYIRSQLYAGRRIGNLFCRLCYELQVEVASVPAFFGIPLLGGDCMKEPAIIWQLQIAQAYEKGVGLETLVASGQVVLTHPEKFSQALEVMTDYLTFYTSIKNSEKTNANLLDNVYDIYCKTVRKLRK